MPLYKQQFIQLIRKRTVERTSKKASCFYRFIFRRVAQEAEKNVYTKLPSARSGRREARCRRMENTPRRKKLIIPSGVLVGLFLLPAMPPVGRVRERSMGYVSIVRSGESRRSHRGGRRFLAVASDMFYSRHEQAWYRPCDDDAGRFQLIK